MNPIIIELQTSQGDIRIQLDEQRAPLCAQNFVNYVEGGHYDGTIFHRVIRNFMIQGGGFTADMQQKTTSEPIRNEASNGLKNNKYTVAMARTSAPHSATAQFFINTADNDFLNFKSESPSGWGYAVFGEVIAGKDIVDKIEGVKTGRKGFHDDVPQEPIVIHKALKL